MNIGTRIALVLGVAGAWLLFSKPSRAAGRAGAQVSDGPVPEDGLIADDVIASFYGGSFFEGKPTASGEPFVSSKFTAAMRKPFPLKTNVRVTNLDNGLSVVVRVNDRGPFPTDSSGNFTRAIDLSVGAAAAIGFDIQQGLARVRLELA